MIEIISVSHPNHYEQIVGLMHEFHQWSCNRYSGERSWEFKSYFEEEAWMHELSALNKIYIPPAGEFFARFKWFRTSWLCCVKEIFQ